MLELWSTCLTQSTAETAITKGKKQLLDRYNNYGKEKHDDDGVEREI